MPNENLMRTSTAARYADVTPGSIKYWDKVGKLPHQLIDGVKYYLKEDIDKMDCRGSAYRTAYQRGYADGVRDTTDKSTYKKGYADGLRAALAEIEQEK